ncbi:MAG: hypothetical protein E7449_04620 [Ruminococcaceae bacterium]|nr:hypothetical protein [Oscillospiraceae bacterium]
MKKNAFLTLLFALIPGAGQMYQSYMKRGVSLMLLFACNVFLTSIIGIAGIFLPVIWAYSFFDTYRLRTELDQGTAAPDALLFSDGTEDGMFRAFLARRHVLVGWLLVLLGSWFIFDNFVLDTLQEILGDYGLWEIYHLVARAPTLLVSVLLIIMGIALMRGRGLSKAKDDYTEYLEPAEEEEEDEEDEDDE